MSQEKLNIFNDLKRIRTPVETFDSRKNYSKPIHELITACRKNKFLGVSPENLSIAGMPPMVVIKDRKDGYIVMLNPKVESKRGSEENIEACGNIFLFREGTEIHPVVLTTRPKEITLSFVVPGGEKKKQTFRGRSFLEGHSSRAAIISHEIDHTKGRTITDIARKRLSEALKSVTDARHVLESQTGLKITPALVKTFKDYLRSGMAFVIIRDGDTYTVRHGSEFEGQPLPDVSEDAIYVDGFFNAPSEIVHIKIPRGGEMIPLKPSKAFSKLLR